jgi:hypothetical protein
MLDLNIPEGNAHVKAKPAFFLYWGSQRGEEVGGGERVKREGRGERDVRTWCPLKRRRKSHRNLYVSPCKTPVILLGNLPGEPPRESPRDPPRGDPL